VTSLYAKALFFSSVESGSNPPEAQVRGAVAFMTAMIGEPEMDQRIAEQTAVDPAAADQRMRWCEQAVTAAYGENAR
jgi:hypothetical protein